ncbi:MAG: hypothetical protein Q4C53_05830 [Clostridia bacterium]|nr:hypothetical protein [Clostridia bacterium]
MSGEFKNLKTLENVVEADYMNDEKKTFIKSEQKVVKRVFGSLEKESGEFRDPAEMYRDLYQTASDTTKEEYGELLQRKHKAEAEISKYEEVRSFCDAKTLYFGHLCYEGNSDYKDWLLMDSCRRTRRVGSYMMVSSDDKNYQNIFREWRSPEAGSQLQFSLGVSLNYRDVSDVDVIYDKISGKDNADAFLKATLQKNKDNKGVQSIIRTIQSKQDKIRTFDVNLSVLVPGCAGSGKTMVLLHRLRYLIYNKMLDQSDFVLLTPAFDFNEFIGETSADFGIKKENILSLTGYYQLISGAKQTNKQDYDEYVYPSDYLNTVYSKEFLRECTEKYLNELEDTCHWFSDVFFKALENRITLEIERKRKEEKKKEQVYVRQVKKWAKKEGVEETGKLETFEEIVKEVLKQIASHYERITKTVSDYPALFVLQKEIGLLTKEELQDEKKAIKTLFSELEEHSDSENDFEVWLKKVYQQMPTGEQNEQMSTPVVFGDEEREISNDLISENLRISELRGVLKKSAEDKKRFHEDLAQTGEQVKKAASMEIKAATVLGNLSAKEKFSLMGLKTLATQIRDVANEGNSIWLSDLMINTIRDMDEEERQRLKLFWNLKTVEASAEDRLFQICKDELFRKYAKKTNWRYKHYWYLKAYCAYLMTTRKTRCFPYVFIDEGQDLSRSEYELICKVNTSNAHVPKTGRQGPVLNIFGDEKQVIGTHSIRRWEEIVSLLPLNYQKVYLSENFRNTNQIVAYCNAEWKYEINEMTPVGIDMGKVDEFETIGDIVKARDTEGCVFIVKDEYAKLDLRQEFNRLRIKERAIRTVKESKGIEYSDTVIAVTRGMTKNERYIAYTRPLKKLCVVKELERYTKPERTLIIEDDDDD